MAWVQHNREMKRLSKPDNSNGASTRVRAEIGTVYDKKYTNTPVCSTSLPSGWPQDKTRTPMAPGRYLVYQVSLCTLGC